MIVNSIMTKNDRNAKTIGNKNRERERQRKNWHLRSKSGEIEMFDFIVAFSLVRKRTRAKETTRSG